MTTGVKESDTAALVKARRNHGKRLWSTACTGSREHTGVFTSLMKKDYGS